MKYYQTFSYEILTQFMHSVLQKILYLRAFYYRLLIAVTKASIDAFNISLFKRKSHFIRAVSHGRRTFFVLNYPLVHLPDFFGFVYIVCLKLYSKQTLFPDFSENKMFFNSACSAQDTDIPCPSRTFFACFSGPSLHSFPVSTGSGLYDGSGSCFLPHSLNASCNCLR